MTIHTVAVLGASSSQGLAQVRQLRRQDYRVRGMTGRTRAVDGQDQGVQWVPADLNIHYPASLSQVFDGADAVFFTSPAFAGSARRLDQTRHVGEAAQQASIERVVYNTSVYIPESLGSEPPYNYVLEGVFALEGTGIPVVTFGPVIFMDNLLTDWSKPDLLQGSFRYPHKPGFRASWMSLNDVGLFMTEALRRDDLIGERIVLGGPDVLTPEIICDTLSRVLGHQITHDPSRRGNSARLCGRYSPTSPGWTARCSSASSTTSTATATRVRRSRSPSICARCSTGYRSA